MKLRVVFDTTTVISALMFANGSLAWLRAHWREKTAVPLVSGATAAELSRVLEYAKFQLSVEDRRELLADYLPYCELIKSPRRCPITCRDAKDQLFLDLATGGKAEVLVSGDRDLLVLAGKTKFSIEAPRAYKLRVAGT